jgi:hypothetical protein
VRVRVRSSRAEQTNRLIGGGSISIPAASSITHQEDAEHQRPRDGLPGLDGVLPLLDVHKVDLDGVVPAVDGVLRGAVDVDLFVVCGAARVVAVVVVVVVVVRRRVRGRQSSGYRSGIKATLPTCQSTHFWPCTCSKIEEVWSGAIW